MAIIINGRQEGLGMKEIEGRPLPLGVTISEDEVNFSVAVPEEKNAGYCCTGQESEPCAAYPMDMAVGKCVILPLRGLRHPIMSIII